jgi:hypothetical protein
MGSGFSIPNPFSEIQSQSKESSMSSSASAISMCFGYLCVMFGLPMMTMMMKKMRGGKEYTSTSSDSSSFSLSS